MCAIFTLWKGESKFTSDTFRTDYINILTVSLNGFLYDGKTKSGSFFIFATGRICLVKTFPYLIQRITRNTDSVILDRYEDFLAAFGGFNCNNRVRIAEFNRIVDQIVEHLLDFVFVSKYGQMPGGKNQFDRYLLLCACAFKRGSSGTDHIMNVERFPVQQKFLCVKCI